MAERRPPTAGLLSRLWFRLKNEWIQDVPEEKAVCGFDCRKERCLFDDRSAGKWRFAREARGMRHRSRFEPLLPLISGVRQPCCRFALAARFSAAHVPHVVRGVSFRRSAGGASKVSPARKGGDRIQKNSSAGRGHSSIRFWEFAPASVGLRSTPTALPPDRFHSFSLPLPRHQSSLAASSFFPPTASPVLRPAPCCSSGLY